MKNRKIAFVIGLNMLILSGCGNEIKEMLGFEDVELVDEKKISYSISQIIGKMETLPADTEPGFRYEQLNEDEKTVYRELAEGISNYSEEIKISCKINEKSLRKVYEAVIYSEKFQMFCTTRAYKYSYMQEEDIVDNIVPCYNFSCDEYEKVRSELEKTLISVKLEISADMSEYEKVKKIHDYIIRKCDYADLSRCTEEEITEKMEREHFGDAYGALIRGDAICEGYSRAFKYICNSLDIGCELINGTGDGTDHMWNLVRIDGKWYHVDVTWDDPVINGVSDESTIVYDYFCLPDEKILEDHIIEEGILLYPRCENTLS